jgi:uncharacterized protein YndB with AHSA1/START domain
VSARVELALQVAATPERAFAVFTGETGLWWKPNELFGFTPRAPGIVAFEPGEGGRFIETRGDGKVFEIGRITIWEPGKRLAFTWRQASFTQDQIAHVEVRFEAIGPRTRVTVIHEGFDRLPDGHVARHGMKAMYYAQRHAGWWRELLEGLKARLEEAR